MPHIKHLLLPLATAAMLTAGLAHAEGRRAAQSLPSQPRFNTQVLTPVRAFAPAKVDREQPKRAQIGRGGGQQREDSANRGRGERDRDRDRDRDRRDDHDRDHHERDKDHDDHDRDHHEHDDSPGG